MVGGSVVGGGVVGGSVVEDCTVVGGWVVDNSVGGWVVDSSVGGSVVGCCDVVGGWVDGWVTATDVSLLVGATVVDATGTVDAVVDVSTSAAVEATSPDQTAGSSRFTGPLVDVAPPLRSSANADGPRASTACPWVSSPSWSPASGWSR